MIHLSPKRWKLCFDVFESYQNIFIKEPFLFITKKLVRIKTFQVDHFIL